MVDDDRARFPGSVFAHSPPFRNFVILSFAVQNETCARRDAIARKSTAMMFSSITNSNNTQL
jgi:hypothetical protein